MDHDERSERGLGDGCADLKSEYYDKLAAGKFMFASGPSRRTKASGFLISRKG